MSIPQPVLQYIVDNLKGRQLLTFSFNAAGAGFVSPVTLFYQDSNYFQAEEPVRFLNSINAAKAMFVYNPVTFRIETLDQTMCMYYNLTILQNDIILWHAIVSVSSALPSEKFTISNGKIYCNQTSSYLIASQTTRSGQSGLNFCSKNSVCGPDQVNITLLNFLSPSAVNTVQDNTTLCCHNDPATLVLAILTWSVEFNTAKQPNYNNYATMAACQAADAVCTCPFNDQCWMFNNTRTQCCYQGNPTDPIFAFDKPVLITQNKSECEAQAVNCNSWRFNTQDVPCCIQRTPAQWLQAGYSNTGLQSFNTKADCDAAAATAGTCNFQSLLNPSTQNKDYYKLILESKYTSGCDLLRTGPYWGNALDCTDDPNPEACYAANCNQNYCTPWIASTSNPYMFTEQVRCLPTATQCCAVGTTRIINNHGESNVFSSCQ